MTREGVILFFRVQVDLGGREEGREDGTGRGGIPGMDAAILWVGEEGDLEAGLEEQVRQTTLRPLPRFMLVLLFVSCVCCCRCCLSDLLLLLYPFLRHREHDRLTGRLFSDVIVVGDTESFAPARDKTFLPVSRAIFPTSRAITSD